MMRAGLLVAVAILAVTALTGCAFHDPYHRSGSLLPPAVPLPAALGPGSTTPTTAPAPMTNSTATAAPTVTATAAAHSPASTFAPSAGAGPSGSARRVIYQFALAYDDLSAAGAAARERTLVSLSTPVFAQTFRAPLRSQELEATRALPKGASMVARVISIQLSPAQGGYDHAVVTLQQALRQADGVTEQPFASSFDVDVLRIGSGWRVAAFTAQP